jgi:hypothetical protein
MPTMSSPGPFQSDAKSDAARRRIGKWRAMVLTGVMARVEGHVTEWTSDGLVFLSDRPFPEDTRLKLVVALTDSAEPRQVRPLTVPLRVTFHVISGGVFRMTCRFEALDAYTRDMIDALLLHSPLSAA